MSLAMDFIERISGISPDAGLSAFELILVAVPVLILASLYVDGVPCL
jgi:hypothetical protein